MSDMVFTKRKWSRYSKSGKKKMMATAVKNRYRMGSQRRPFRIGKSLISRNVHRFTRGCPPVAHTMNLLGATEYNFTQTFKLEDVVNSAEFSTLYDRYMITCVVLKFQLVNNPDAIFTTPALGSSIPGGQIQNWFPKLWYCKDYDDSSDETLNELRERAKTKHFVMKPNREYKIVIRPAISIQTYRTASTTGYAPAWKQWVDMAQTNVPHYGLKYVFDLDGIIQPNTNPWFLRCERQYYFKCKDVK